MSRFFSERFAGLTPYTPGEQPRELNVVKLNTNESPFPPSEKALRYMREHARPLNLYPELHAVGLRTRIAALHGVKPENILLGNGSDELLNFAFMAFCDERSPAAFPDITYGFYPVYAALNRVPYEEIPLREDFSVDPADYCGIGRTIFLANPNAPTGMLLGTDAIEEIAASNPGHVVVVDEAYIDFGGVSCVPLIRRHDNLLVVQTFSKSRSMAGARLGFAAGDEALIRDLNSLLFSVNPYNVNAMTMALGEGILEDAESTERNCRTIMENRAYTVAALEALGFSVLPSAANFVLAASDRIGGAALYLALKERGVLVRHFDIPAIRPYIRITIGTREQMDILLAGIRDILEGRP